MREMIARFTLELKIGQQIKNGELRKKIIEPHWRVPRGYDLSVIEGANCTMELLEAECKNPNMVILQLHGGGYIGGMRNAYRNFAVAYAKAASGSSVLTPDYRLAPEHPFPAALEDAVYAYQWLLLQGWDARQITVAGDSAGGGLALALVHYLKDHKQEVPGGLVVMSPWTDMTASGVSYEENYRRDPLFGNSMDTMLQNRDYAGTEREDHPYLSPLFGDLRDFPPMLIQVGGYEMLLSDSEQLAVRVKESGGKVHLSVYPGMFHVFQMAMGMLPESKRAWTEIQSFLRALLHYHMKQLGNV